MKKSIRSMLVGVCSMGMLSVATSALAQERSGFYVGTGIGYSVNLLENDNVYSKNGTEKRTDTGFKFYGGYQFNNNWAIEGQYLNIGTYAGDTKNRTPNNMHITAKASGFSVAAVGMLPLGQSFALFGKAGAILKTVDASEYNDLKTLRREVKSTKTSALLGAGVEFKVTPQLVLRAEYEYLGKTPLSTNDNGPQLRNDMVSVGARYTF
ncbi:outer membrane beta-barrel protein [Herbaspirillum autotrophicum]|uniref:outer membrane beta-barrel protein n=1 Tax=Herbaspirillum autotrophicum TaxID=180195 RepID=UPI000A8D8EB4|nr:outer membrane beta-barrel protein [Herbaspirillum autotrophicum]